MYFLDRVSSAIAHALFEQLQADIRVRAGSVHECDAFVLGQVRRMPDYLRPAFYLLATCLMLVSLVACGRFYAITPEKRMIVLRRFKRLPGPCKDFFLFYHTLVSFYLFSVMNREELR